VDLGPAPLAMRARARDESLAFEVTAGNRTIANPTLVAAAGRPMRIALANALPEPTIVHWHGLATDTRNDGNGESLIPPGGRYDYAFELRNRAGLYWYHPHPHGATAAQIYRGLFGLIEVGDDDERLLRKALDLAPGTTELALVLQDRRVGDGDRYAPAPEDELLGWYGCQPHVNGVLRPHHDVAARRYRLRVLNASNARTYRLAFRRDDGTALPFMLIGTDGGLLERGIRCEQVLLSPAERLDLLVDFADVAKGGFVILESRGFDPMQAVTTPSTMRSEESTAGHGHSAAGPAAASMADGSAFDLLQFRIRASARGANPALPERLSRLPPVVAASGDERPLRLGFAKGRWRINDRVYDPQATPIEVARGASETWLLRNYHTSAPHAMHLHGFQFRVLERETSPDQLAPLAIDARGRLPTDLGFKDTVLVWPGESVRIAIDFRLPYAGSQIYLLHCHNLEHEDAGMMLRVKVG
jgi:suppressor of ftsI/bilirubin oxidase